MNDRLMYIDNLRGVAFIFMIIQHIVYFYDVSNNYKTSYAKNNLIETSGTISRTLFILLAGYSVYMAWKKNKKNFIKKRFYRSIEIFCHALVISLVTYIAYPSMFIRFGILHFLSLATFILSFLAPYNIATIIFFIISISITYPQINNTIDTITGASVNYNMMDWFPLNKWIPVILCGMIIAQNIDLSILNNIDILKNKNILTILGKNSLNLYTLHIILLIIYYKK